MLQQLELFPDFDGSRFDLNNLSASWLPIGSIEISKNYPRVIKHTGCFGDSLKVNKKCLTYCGPDVCDCECSNVNNIFDR